MWHRPTPPWVHAPAWGIQSRASRGDTAQDIETPHIEEAGCRDTTLHCLHLPEGGSNTKNNPKPHSSSIKDGNTAHQCCIHTPFPTLPAAVAHPQGDTTAAGRRDEGSPKEATTLPAFGRCCVSREEFGPDTGLQRDGSTKTPLHR